MEPVAPLRCLGGMPPSLRAISEVGMAVIELLAKVFAKLVDLTGCEFDVIMIFVNNWEIVVRSNRQEYPQITKVTQGKAGRKAESENHSFSAGIRLATRRSDGRFAEFGTRLYEFAGL